MRDDLVDITDLMALLGYTDPRSVAKWCNARNIPLIKAGLKKYILSQYLTQYIDNQLVTFDKGNISLIKSPLSSNKETSKRSMGKYTSESEIVNKYLSKYETDKKSKTS